MANNIRKQLVELEARRGFIVAKSAHFKCAPGGKQVFFRLLKDFGKGHNVFLPEKAVATLHFADLYPVGQPSAAEEVCCPVHVASNPIANHFKSIY